MRGRGQVLGLVIDHPQHLFPNTQLISVSSFFRNYVFQRRFVQFNGRSLMYFGSDKVRGLELLHGYQREKDREN